MLLNADENDYDLTSWHLGMPTDGHQELTGAGSFTLDKSWDEPSDCKYCRS